MTGAPETREPGTPADTRYALLLAAVTALALVGALGLTAAEDGRGLDNADLRTVIVVTIAVFVAASVVERRRRRSG